MIVISKKNENIKKDVKVSGFEIVSLDIREMQKEGAKFSMTQSNLRSNKITICSSEIVRIVCAFNPDNLEIDKKKKSSIQYAYIKDLIILKIGKSYNAYYKSLCEEREDKNDIGVFTLDIVDIDKDNQIKVLETIRYKRLLCGSSYVRNSKELYIREELYDKVMEVLLTGIKSDALYPKDRVAKYSTYLGLASTDSIPVSMPNICVVKDFSTKIKDSFDIVEQIKTNGKFEYKVTNFADSKQETEEEVNCFDGAGIVSYERACIWAKELGLNYVPSSFQIRVLNGIKGNLYTFPVTEYIDYLEENGLSEHLKIQDLWKESVNIKEQNIDVFLTESQFKFHNMYESFNDWKNAFDIEVEYNGHAYKRQFNISEVSKDIRKIKDEVWSAYQPLQTLQFTDDELKELAQPTVLMAQSLYTDMDAFIKYRGIAIESDKEECDIETHNSIHNLTPWYYKALSLDDSLQYDPYIRKKIAHDLESLQRRIFMGKIILNGNYQTAMPDLLALMEHICNRPVVGILKKGEIYSNYWNTKQVNKVSIWRNPHIACEWVNANVVDNGETKKWFKYQQTGIVTDIYGTMALRCGTMDFDGDTIATIHSDIIHKAIERADIHTIKFIPYKEEKAQQETFCINNHSVIMNTNKLGFQNNIGDVTNKVTVLWAAYGNATSDEEKNKISNYIKVMSVINQLIIDFVKTGTKVPIPKDILQKVAQEKKPAFMQNKKGKWVDDKKVETTAKHFSYALNESTITEIVEEQKKYKMSKGTVDKLYEYLLEVLNEMEINFKSSTEECQFTKLLKDIPYPYNATYPKVKAELKQLLQIHNTICGKKYYDEKVNVNIDDSTWRFNCFYNHCENRLLNICSDRKLLLDYLIYLFYTDKDFYHCDKSILWNIFGQDICNRYIRKEINVSTTELKKLKKKEEKANRQAEAIEKLCSNANIINIKDLPQKAIYITDAEVNYIKESVDDKEAQKLLVALLGLERKINAENKKGQHYKVIKIEKGKKNSVTMYQICKLADIYYNQIDNRLQMLYEKQLIDIDLQNLKVPKIKVCIPTQKKIVETYQILDINDIRKNVLEYRFA